MPRRCLVLGSIRIQAAGRAKALRRSRFRDSDVLVALWKGRAVVCLLYIIDV